VLRYSTVGGELMAALLRRLILDYRTGELVVRCLYRTEDASSAGPNTKARRREVQDLVREGLRQALAALDSEAGDVTMCGTSGFTQREDVILATASPDAAKLVKAELKGA